MPGVPNNTIGVLAGANSLSKLVQASAERYLDKTAIRTRAGVAVEAGFWLSARHRPACLFERATPQCGYDRPTRSPRVLSESQSRSSDITLFCASAIFLQSAFTCSIPQVRRRILRKLVGGKIKPSQLLRKLASYPRQNDLAVALREVGRVKRTLFIIEWILDTDMQRRAQIGLNKGEAHHALKNALRIGR